MTVRVHINGHRIRANKRHGTNEPPVAIRRGRTVEYAHEVELIGPSRVVYRPDRPLSCGARLWIEAEDVKLLQPETSA